MKTTRRSFLASIPFFAAMLGIKSEKKTMVRIKGFPNEGSDFRMKANQIINSLNKDWFVEIPK